jgi:hypothetical protein
MLFKFNSSSSKKYNFVFTNNQICLLGAEKFPSLGVTDGLEIEIPLGVSSIIHAIHPKKNSCCSVLKYSHGLFLPPPPHTYTHTFLLTS